MPLQLERNQGSLYIGALVVGRILEIPFPVISFRLKTAITPLS